jgi:hypothetical protein
MTNNLQYTLFKEGFYKNREEERQKEKLIDSLQDLKEIQNNLNDILLKQDHELSRVEENMSTSENRIQQSFIDLQAADNMYFSYKPILIGGVLGATLCSPIAFLLGVKYIGLSSGLGGILGSAAGYQVNRL